MNAMKWIVTMALVAGCAVDEADEPTTSATTQEATNVDVWTGTWNGASAHASSWSQYGGGYVDVFENGTGQNRSAYLNFSTSAYDPTSQQCFDWTDWWGYTYHWCYFTRYTYTYGWGQISAQDVQITGTNARVSTTLPSSYYSTQCTVDWYNWSYTCTTGTGGTVDLRWRKDGQSSYFQSGTQQYAYGAYTFKSQGGFRSASAQAEGSLLGNAFAGSGGLGDTRGTSVSKSVFKTPNP